jgi:hypothetical protein
VALVLTMRAETLDFGEGFDSSEAAPADPVAVDVRPGEAASRPAERR